MTVLLYCILLTILFFLVPDSPSLKRKVKEIETLLSNDPNPPVDTLKNLALSEGGLVCGKLRFRMA